MPLNETRVITFKQATFAHKDIIFEWLDYAYIKEFWDNSQEHRSDIINFMEGRKTPSVYGIDDIIYWVGFIDDAPYCFILTSKYEKDEPDISDLHRKHLSKKGNTYSIDFCIGNKKYLGKGLASPTLEAFTSFFQREIDPTVGAFLIDPNENNPRAIHVYKKAGFKHVGYFSVEKGFFAGHRSLLMAKTNIV